MWPSIFGKEGRPSRPNTKGFIFLAAAVILFLIASLSDYTGFSPADHVPSALKGSSPAAGAIVDSPVDARPSFYDIAKKTGTDKVTDHEYHWMYEKYLPALRDKKIRMLEIGLGCNMGYGPGASYHLWLEYFPFVELYFIEYDAACVNKWSTGMEGATIFTGDQADPDFLEHVIASTGGSFDIIIDDGGHSMTQQEVSLEHLWKAVKPGGIYFLEDLQTSFMPAYGGDGQHGDDRKKKTMLKYIYEMIGDRMLPKEQVQEGTKHKWITGSMRAVECQREVCAFFKKDERKVPRTLSV